MTAPDPAGPAGRGLSRRAFFGTAVTLGAGVAAAPWLLAGSSPAPAAASTAAAAHVRGDWAEADYWAFADRLQPLLDPLWSERRGGYMTPGGGETSLNGCLLVTHAAAALRSHGGPSRQDARARRLVATLCGSPPFRTDQRFSGTVEDVPGARSLAQRLQLRVGDQTHVWGWGNMLNTVRGQHVVVDTQAVRGLLHAWRARGALGLDDVAVALISDRIRRCAFSQFYAYPQLRLNQINWPLEIYAAAATVTGDRRLLVVDSRLQFDRFAHAMTSPVRPHRSPFLGPGYRFHYLPQQDGNSPTNVDSAEYATIVCGALEFYEPARGAGMGPLTDTQEQRVRAWVERVLCGYWTHGGYLNWDTGMSFRRWHQGKKLGLCQDALLAIAVAARFQPTPAHGRWAKWILDRGFELYERTVDRAGGLPEPNFFGITATPGSLGDSRLTAARLQANAARAVLRGLGGSRAAEPPPLYAYDPDTGRLAITTPAYNTAVVAVDNRRLPYGGMELARLFDGDQNVIAGTGGRPLASFGVVVRDHRTGGVLASQRGRPRPDLRDPPLRLRRAPRGAQRHLPAYPRHAYAGPFRELIAEGWSRSRNVSVRTRHRFRADWIETRWTLRERRRGGPYTAHVLFPTWGAGTITAVLRDGRELAVRGGRLSLALVAWFHLGGTEGGYVVVPRGRVPRGVAHLLHPRPQDSNPRPGPTLSLEVLDRARLRTLDLTVRLAPAADLAAARAAASRLRGRG